MTAVVLTRNEERALARALTSLPRGMAVLVLDAQSTDRTQEIARSHGATVVERPWSDFVDARRFALERVQTRWVLMLDADEALDRELRDAIVAAPRDTDGYLLSRTTFFCGKPIRIWSNERLLRLFRRDAVWLEARPASGGHAALHERWMCSGSVSTLPGVLLHESYPDVAAYRRKFDRYTSIEAEGVNASRSSVAAAHAKALLRFAWLTIVRAELLDGWRGIYVAWFSALYPAVVARKAWRR
ncbi:MAG TPA: glycosyltransferase family 2 protein [Candidatus Baltobacteraceae bacterium]